MSDFFMRCSSLGKIMVDPISIPDEMRTPEIAAIIAKSKRTDAEKAALADCKARSLSDMAKAELRHQAAQEILGIDFVIQSRQFDKGNQCEQEAIALLNRVRGLSLVKNAERRTVNGLSGECDLFDAATRDGYDTKCAWSAATFPITAADIQSASTAAVYEWQARAYMKLWDADRWTVAYCLLDTPVELIGYEPASLHVVSHIPEHHRLTTWTIERDATKEALIETNIAAARDYYAEVIAEFDATHKEP